MILHLARVSAHSTPTLEHHAQNAAGSWSLPPSRMNETVLCAKCKARIPPKGKTGFNRN